MKRILILGVILASTLSIALFFLPYEIQVSIERNFITAEPAGNISSIPLTERVGQLFIIGHWTSIPLTITEERIRNLHAGGIIVMDAPQDASSIAYWTTTWQAAASPTPLFIGIDQEGGSVTRLRGSGFTSTAQPAIDTPEAARSVAAARAGELRNLGINMNFAPVLDRSIRSDSFMYNRVFRDPDQISTLGNAMIESYQNNGVIASPKHFPGHPDTADDSHITKPILNLSEYQYHDHTVTFEDVINTGDTVVLMTAHVGVPELDDTYPATLSPVILGDLRTRLGFRGIILTDDLAMRAISDTWTHEEAAIQALRAGADMILIAAEPEKASSTIAAVIQAVESSDLPEDTINDSYERVMQLKTALQ